MVPEELSDDDLDQMTADLEDIIKQMHSHMGRFPTKTEVINFVFGTDAERSDILDDGRQ